MISDEFAFNASGAIDVKFDLSKSFVMRGEVEYDYVEGFKFATTHYLERSHTVLANALSVDFGYRRITSSFYKLKHNQWEQVYN